MRRTILVVATLVLALALGANQNHVAADLINADAIEALVVFQGDGLVAPITVARNTNMIYMAQHTVAGHSVFGVVAITTSIDGGATHIRRARLISPVVVGFRSPHPLVSAGYDVLLMPIPRGT